LNFLTIVCFVGKWSNSRLETIRWYFGYF